MKEIKNNSLYIDIELPDGFVKDAMNKKTKRYLSALKENFENLLFLPTWFKKEKIKFDGENFKVEINSTFESLKSAIIYPSYYNEYSDSPYYKKDRHDDETYFFINEFLNKLKSPQISEEESKEKKSNIVNEFTETINQQREKGQEEIQQLEKEAEFNSRIRDEFGFSYAPIEGDIHEMGSTNILVIGEYHNNLGGLNYLDKIYLNNESANKYVILEGFFGIGYDEIIKEAKYTMEKMKVSVQNLNEEVNEWKVMGIPTETQIKIQNNPERKLVFDMYEHSIHIAETTLPHLNNLGFKFIGGEHPFFTDKHHEVDNGNRKLYYDYHVANKVNGILKEDPKATFVIFSGSAHSRGISKNIALKTGRDVSVICLGENGETKKPPYRLSLEKKVLEQTFFKKSSRKNDETFSSSAQCIIL